MVFLVQNPLETPWEVSFLTKKVVFRHQNSGFYDISVKNHLSLSQAHVSGPSFQSKSGQNSGF